MREPKRSCLVAGFLCLPVVAETQRTSANITYRIPEGVYVNVGTDAGLEQLANLSKLSLPTCCSSIVLVE